MNQVLSQLTPIISHPSFFMLLVFWTVTWKGISLWQAANRRHLPWFIILLMVNTVGILEIAYILWLHKLDLDQGRLLKFIETKFKRSH